ncbi:MAG: response regulator transcription factor [Acidimicrobiales bacterium]
MKGAVPAMADCIAVQICDDQGLVRAGLRRLLEAEPGIEVLGEASNAAEAVAQARIRRPDVLILDVVLPGRSGLGTLAEILRGAPGTPVLVLAQQGDPAHVRRAFAAGATGYLLMEAAGSELMNAIREVASGNPYLHPVLGARLAAEADPLSEREHEVLHMLALGYTNQEIAKLLFMSVRTAETHRGRIMQKLGLRTRAELVRYALGAGELDNERPVATICGLNGDGHQLSHSVPTPVATVVSTRSAKDRHGQRATTPHLAEVRRIARPRLPDERLA